MGCHLLLAVRPPEEGKSRLAETLDHSKRIELNFNMFRHSLKVGRELFRADRIIVVSRSPALLDEARALGAQALAEAGNDLNAALEQATRHAIERGAEALLSLSSDLPALTADDVQALLDAPTAIAIATDRLRQGTNGLRMRPAGAIRFRYGEGSLAAHLAAARAAGLEATVVERPGLANDIDTPADLAELRSDRRS
ncbi:MULTISPECIES: 2-phospho-L-lactate guanylyltransferase [unclassified Sphingomonas]|uniref:2-phospho-L-lactate guanylyltransferase n=1 Tax=unclassified Sphingomonas TaxID=196159 RepID=UPI0006F83607|nr:MULTISPECIES: 2-phospho-L-lactate guanylyltransferase [unclassified Sphingomonas]KQX20023.1 2-phospho-L-lactate guanylyltransferase [Sphingomonas sp. Root1294]KQY67272.1 2-phospho-L-lactate guanylyltransferase [Sphingomonas sp. Root50]KRB90646.1 2-phospho-L-lactate guanylyltransferase [Sphingomonas sp. Root720]